MSNIKDLTKVSKAGLSLLEERASRIRMPISETLSAVAPTAGTMYVDILWVGFVLNADLSLVLNSALQGFECVRWLGEYQLRSQRSQESCADTQDCRTAGVGYLRHPLHFCQHQLLCVSIM